MAAAYRYADGGPVSDEIKLLNLIDRWGVLAVMGRPVLWAREVRAMTLAETIVNAHRSRAASTSQAAWLKENPDLGQLLFEAQKLAETEDAA